MLTDLFSLSFTKGVIVTRYLVQLPFTRGKEMGWCHLVLFVFFSENYAKEYLLMLVEFRLAGPAKHLKRNF